MALKSLKKSSKSHLDVKLSQTIYLQMLVKVTININLLNPLGIEKIFVATALIDGSHFVIAWVSEIVTPQQEA